MLRETRKYLEENFQKDVAITGSTCYRYNQSGYWQLCVNYTFNQIDIIQGSKYIKLITNSDKVYAWNVNNLYIKFYRQMSKLFKLHKFKPKRMKAKEIAILLDVYKEYEEEFELTLKKATNYYKVQKMEDDFE